jgi:hypothetical protein
VAIPTPEILLRSGMVVGVTPTLVAPQLLILGVLPVRVVRMPVFPMSFAWEGRKAGCEPARLRRRWGRCSYGRFRVGLTSTLGRRVEDDRMGRRPSCLESVQSRSFGQVLLDFRTFALLD